MNFFIQWHLTNACNLNCLHCYGEGKASREMTANEVKRQIDDLALMFQAWEQEYEIRLSPSIQFTGGEPLLYNGLYNILSHAKEKGFELALMTNGSLITRDDSKRLKDIDLNDIQVSIEGPQSVHDSIRGKGSFRAMVRGVEYLIREGNKVSAMVTLSRLNFGMIEETVEIGKSMGLWGLGFARLVPCGQGQNLLGALLTPLEVKCAYEKIQSLRGPSFSVTTTDPLSGLLRDEGPGAGCLGGCSAGFFGVTIGSDGAVMPCRRIGLVVGNIREKSLREIWSTSEILLQLRDRASYHGKCGRCELWPSCRGCRAVAYTYSMAQGKADLFGDDPQCWKKDEDFP